MSVDMAKNEYLLIGADQSMYTQKVRAYMRNNAIPFRDVLPDLKMFKTVVLPNAPYAVIPDLMIVDKATKKYKLIQDSKAIIGHLQKSHGLPVVTGSRRAFADMLLEMIIDDFFFLHALNWRWGFPTQQKYLEYTFGDTGGKSSEATLKNGARVLKLVGSRTASLGLTEKTAEVFREQLDAFLDLLTQHLESYQFFLGNQPTLVDYAIYGQIGSGLFRDPVPYERVTSKYPTVHAYAQRVGGTAVRWGSRDVVQVEVEGDTVVACESTMGMCRSGTVGTDAALNGGIPETATRMTALLLKDYLTILEPTVGATLNFLQSQGEKDEVVVPRSFKADKVYEFALHGRDGKEVREKRIVTTHCVWAMQRILDSTYLPEQRAEVDSWLAEVGYLQEWKRIVGIWEAGGWRVDLTEKGTVGTRKNNSSAKL
ncbi:hypothetical protein DRE_01095 [Drechslerella stenobrocha 248]|uniref:GST C-terminal domain-containing protein n=1 Tax=Drechslerella stenobrocha 248 TaxID=1043628 RepID=W7HMD7_9PEZI|nr:hypothetical protein DRE_01095 [Drechslerella stenobrocha 248]